MLTEINGFVRTENCGWLNLSRLNGILIEEREGKFILFALLDSLGNGILICECDSKQQAVLELDQFFLHRILDK